MTHLSVGDYGVVGNQASAALVSRLGSIDWLCLPYLDSPSHFAALLDENRGGRFQIMPQGDFRSEQRYLQRTHVLETLFETPQGRATLLDWMPMDPKGSQDPVIHRRIEMAGGKIAWTLNCSPRFGYGEHLASAELSRGAFLFRGTHLGEYARLVSEVPLEIQSNRASASARFTLEAGQRASFTWSWGRRSTLPEFGDPKPTLEAWRSLAHRCPPDGCVFAGPWHDAITRSGLVLKLLATPYAGSVAEAITTSLPGTPGGSRTWDYRYAWIRDGAMMMQALDNLGYEREARDYFGWISDIVLRDGAAGLQAVYSLDGGRSIPEHEIDFLAGHKGARPVRVGNQAHLQFQLDIFGHVLLAATEHQRRTGALPPGLWPRLAEIADYVCQAWRRPDHGPWEVRSKPEHFVASKVLCWATLDRSIRLANQLNVPAPTRWHEERKILQQTVLTQGFDESRTTFVRSFGDRDLDSSTLLIPLVGFLPIDDPRVQGTLTAIQSGLMDGVFLYRYKSADGVPGSDGPSLLSSFMFVSCLALAGRADEAGDRLAELCSYASPLGLFAEQIDPAGQETAGNFPSAAVHAAAINAALYVGQARGRRVPTAHLLGTFTKAVQTSRRQAGV